MIAMTFFYLAIFLTGLLAIESLAERKFYISDSVSATLCEQSKIFAETKNLQAPAKSAPASVSKSACNWYHVRESTPESSCGSSIVSTISCDTIERKQKAATGLAESGKRDGINGESGSTKVIGGEEAEPNEFPATAAFVTMFDNGVFSKSCGGTIIHAEWVLTAVHCIRADEGYSVLVGGHNLLPSSEPNRKEHKVVQIIKHPGYIDETTENDVALLRVEPPIEMNDKVKAAKLPKPDFDIPPGTPVTLAGWGVTSNQTNPPAATQVLMKAELEILDDEACRKGVAPDPVLPGMVCTNFEKDNRGACFGDSGGPLYQIDGDVHTLVGSVSWGTDCHASPTVYSEIAYFVPWIKENTCGAIPD